MNLKLAAIVLALVAAFASGMKVEHDRNQKRITAEKLQAEIQSENNRLLAQSRINKIDRSGASRAKKQAETDQSTLAKVDKYAPRSLPLLPGSVRVLHDAAATGQEIDDSSAANASPVAVADLASTTARNYIAARSNERDLEELQAIVRVSGCFDLEEE